MTNNLSLILNESFNGIPCDFYRSSNNDIYITIVAPDDIRLINTHITIFNTKPILKVIS